MPTPAVIRTEFDRKVLALQATRQRLEDLHARRFLTVQDMERIYSSLFLNLYTAFEAYIESTFIALLVTREGARPRRRAYPRVAVQSAPVARELVKGDRPYAAWMPYQRTESLAKVFFREGRPFTNLSTARKKKLEEMSWIRNALAHSSQSTQETFRKKLVPGYLRPAERRPAGFLRGIPVGPSQSPRYENYADDLLAAAADLAV